MNDYWNKNWEICRDELCWFDWHAFIQSWFIEVPLPMVSFSSAWFAFFYHLHRSSIVYFAAHSDIVLTRTYTIHIRCAILVLHNLASHHSCHRRRTGNTVSPWQRTTTITKSDISYRESHIADAVFGPFAERRTVFYHNTAIQTKEQYNKNLISFAENVYIQNKTRTFGLCSVDSLPALAVRLYRTLNSDASHLLSNDGGVAKKS